jgi:Thioesterase-like superfamily
VSDRPTGGFDRATAVHRLRSSALAFRHAAAGATGFAAEIDAGWCDDRGRAPSGYVAALLVRAISHVAPPETVVRSVSLHYSGPIGPGAVEIFATLLATADTASTITATLEQGERAVVVALASFASADGPIAPEHVAIPQPEAIPAGPGWGTWRPARGYELCPAMLRSPEAGDGEALCGGWISLCEPSRNALDTPTVTAFATAWMPAPLARPEAERSSWSADPLATTIDFRVCAREAAAGPQRCLGVFRSHGAGPGIYSERGELWSTGGRLLARTRHVGLLRT